MNETNYSIEEILNAINEINKDLTTLINIWGQIKENAIKFTNYIDKKR